jgi:NTE family protein
MGKNALVLGGGGAKGAYEAGVLKALKKLKYKYDIVTGTSVGSINGAAAAQGDIALAEKIC